MSDLIDLAAQIEQAQGASYALDCAIWDAIYPGERKARFEKLTAKGQPYHGRLGPADMDGYVKPLRAFTASLDAAATLVPEGWSFGAGKDDIIPGPTGWAWVSSDDDTNIVKAATPALALVSAALKARAHIKGE